MTRQISNKKAKALVRRCLELLARLPQHKREWFIGQMEAHQSGQPNVFQGTVDVPDWWDKDIDGDAPNWGRSVDGVANAANPS